MSREKSGLPQVLLVATVLVVAANLRPAISAVGPLLEQIRTDTGLSPSLLGLLGAIPVLSFGVISPFVAGIAARWGLERSIFASLLLLAVGTVLRSLPPGALPGDESTSAQLSLLSGTVILSAAIGVGNVLVPAVVKRDFPTRVPFMTGLYTATMAGFAALASGTAVPISRLGGWELALGAGALIALIAAGVWAVRLREPDLATGALPLSPVSGSSRSSTVWTSAVAWQVTAYFALQSTLFYLLLTWYPSMLAYQGIGEAYAGWMLSLWQGIGIVASLTVGPVLQRSRDQRLVAALVCTSLAASLIGLVAAPALVPLWSLLGGFSTGTMLLLALTMITLRASTTHEAGQLSGMAQGVGYLCAGSGPLLAGAAFDLTGSWMPVIVGMLVATALLAGVGMLAGRAVTLR
ncbi:MFS transporter [Nesterenkonia sp. NBAIMH1]|uniref:MFS transporter n=1 Tax=Nesterenkonia sp. NBAIMH1 TaxID=2600320 RepID=UPI00143D0E06|nr:MFS transporter [Nesterenkonia sp. NBAIMH1]